MNENLDLVEILKDCPRGTKLYSPVFGEVEFNRIDNDAEYHILVLDYVGMFISLTKDGKLFDTYNDAECILFPSREQRDWSTYKLKKPKFDPKTLKPYDKVLSNVGGVWSADMFSHVDVNTYTCVGCDVEQVIPYNDDTKHLIGTTDEAPEYYRYWEE